MKILTNGLNVKVTEGMKESLENKLDFLNKFLAEDTEVSVKITSTKSELKLVTMFVYNGKLIKATVKDDDFYVAIDKTVDNLKSQVKKQHNLKIKRENDQSETIRTYFVEDMESDTPEIIKRKAIHLEPMSEKEAIDEMDKLGHNTFLFYNNDIDAISMLYQRNDGHYGLVYEA